MYYYDVGGVLAASALPAAPFPAAPEGRPALFLLDRDPGSGRTAFRVTDPRQLTARREDVSRKRPVSRSRMSNSMK